jgi:fatty acid desaturase
MNQHPLDLTRYRWAATNLPATELDAEQVRELDEHARRYRAWAGRHPVVHNVVTVGVLAVLLAADIGVVAWAGGAAGAGPAALVVTAIHGYLTYSLTIYTMHEGAGHQLLIVGRSRAARLAGRVARSTCRLFFADPDYYASVHPSHHAQLATEGDGAYTHYVAPDRFVRSLLPLAGLLPFNDYLIHTDHSFSRSHVRSLVLGIAYHALLLWLLAPATGVLLGVVVFVVLAPWLAFTLDRVRETYDHLLTPDHRRWGARSLGLGVSGMLFGGGPWGQPCHLAHHWAPGLPWYLQLRLHRDFRRVLRPDQQEVFLTPGPTSFVRRYRQNLHEIRAAARAVPDGATTAAR